MIPTCAEETSQRSLEKTARRLGKEALQWGLAAGVYTGVTYSMQEARGISDWVCVRALRPLIYDTCLDSALWFPPVFIYDCVDLVQ